MLWTIELCLYAGQASGEPGQETGGRGRLLRNRPLLIWNPVVERLPGFHSAVNDEALLVSEATVREKDRRPGAMSQVWDIRTRSDCPCLVK